TAHPRRGQLPKRRQPLLQQQDGGGGGQLATACSSDSRQVFDDLSESAGFCRASRRRRRRRGPPPPRLEEPEADRQTVDTRCASRSATSQNSKRNKRNSNCCSQQQPLCQASRAGDENKVETLIEDEAQSKEAGQSQQLEENIQEEQDEEEEDPDIGVESFVSGDISRPCPESEAVQLALGNMHFPRCNCNSQQILEEHLSDYRKLKQNSQAMLVFLHCLLARGRKAAAGEQPVASVLRLAGRGLERCHRLHQAEALRRYAYEIYSTFLHEESPLSLLASNSDADASRQQLHDEAVHPLERLFGIGASTGADPASTVRAAADKPRPGADGAHAGAPGKPARWPTCSKNDVTAFCRTCCRRCPAARHRNSDVCSPPDAGRDCWPALRMLRQSESAPAAAEASCLAHLLVRGLDPELAESLAPGESPMLFGCQHRSVGRQKSLLSRMGRAAASAASASSGSGAAPDERLRVGAHALEPCALTKAQVCAACDQVLCGAAPQGLQCTADCEQVVHRSCAQQLSSAPCTKRAAARAKDASIGCELLLPACFFCMLNFECRESLKKFRRSSNRRRLRHQRPFIAGVDASSDASTTICRWRIDEVEDWMLSGRQVQRNIPDCADDLPILKLTSSRSDQAVSQLAAETFPGGQNRAKPASSGQQHR
uniref:Phorbol-ester/DAG-type domain-containing protein n=1 Tax=Macrostomum lignano TaxID=282301 RepID=A0A1I8JQC1_9PLAT